jgi:glycosyl hydrolase family 113
MKIQSHLSLRSLCLLAVVAIVAALAYLLPRALAQSQSGFQYNGIVHVSWWFDEYDSTAGGTSRAALRDTGSNWMGLLVTWYQQDASSNVIARHPDPNKDHTDARIRTAIRDAHSRGLQVMLKPHVDALNGQWRGDFNPSNPAAWFQSYTQFILHYAQIAQEEGVELYCMGTEFKTISGAANRDRWVAVINAIRGDYGGPLTYAANATFPADEFTSVSFWDQIDIIGLDGYFTLTDQNNPTLAQLISAWTSNRFGENIVAAVQNFASSRQKPVIFTEIGYKSTDGTNREPWNFGLSGAIDTAEQRDCYQAAFTVWSQQSSWMRGFFWWAWPVPPPAANDGDYNPRSKPAETVLRTWQGPGDNPNFTLSASPTSLTVNRGASGASTITITRSGGFTSAVSLSATGLPSGVTATFNPPSATGGSSALTLAASSTAATGTVNVTINGSGGGLNRSTTLSLTVNAPLPPDFTLSVNPSNLTINRGASSGATVTIARTGGFNSVVALSASGLPSGVTASFESPPGPVSVISMFIAASSTAATGMTSVTINGSGGGLTRSTTLVVTVNAPPASDFTLSASPASLMVNRGASGASTITIARAGGFTNAVALSATGLPSGVTATFSPASATGTTSTLTLAASSAATTGTVNVTVSGTGGGLTRSATLSLTVNADTGTGGVTVTPAVTANGPWFNEQVIRLNNTASITALSVTITIQRTTGVGFNGQYNTVGGQILQSNTVAATTITYQFSLAAGQTLGVGTNRMFAAQMGGSGTIHPTAGDTWVVTYTTGGVAFTQTGHF